jgi:hypothetical protein
VNIRVKHGAREKVYKIFRNLLKWHSAYFAAALDPSSGFNNHIQTLEIECEFDIFEAFHCWLHTGKLKEVPKSNEDKKAEELYLSSLLVCKIWVFADYHGVPALGNSAIDMLHERGVAEWVTPDNCVTYVYGNTTVGSKLRAYVVDEFILTMELADIQSANQSFYTVAFLFDVLPAMARANEETWLSREKMTKIDRCRWHDHSGPGGQIRLESRK